MERLLTLLKQVNSEVDFENNKSLVTDGVLDSIDIISIVSSIEEEYSIEIDPTEIDPDNFESAEAILEMIKRYIN
ncbi:phosphopantetheine-binding protein [Butyrivibrio proteoclasticus B316]|uniref:Phosphopantetheine-binding protein n=1 Tax=Butyrivibrio proteoclasticus (strain ATCC 51982 / DSM 14932 / B316) TaxID=515622 RepID=E0RZH0_BUTPB|nr:phosphopantetheine-binding protein [Butyrivibrio proteoclasticus]ADL33167.1 phosphopantetheine-binding protein [Butyrivibrio proteoclasticus B316]